MQTLSSSEMRIYAHQSTRCHNQEDYNLNQNCIERLELYIPCKADVTLEYKMIALLRGNLWNVC